MAVSVSVGKIKKAVNSTQVSGYAADLTASAVLKEPCDVRNPVFILKGSAGNYNYANWGDRYYWVDKVIPFPNGIIEVHCHLDPLGTYQTDILNTKAWMSFNSMNVNTEIDDPRLTPDICDTSAVTNSGDIFASTPTPQNGNVVVTTFEAGYGSDNQGVKTYVMSLTNFMKMLKNLQNSLYDTIYDKGTVATDINNRLSSFTDPDSIVNMIGAVGTTLIHDVIEALSDMVSNIGGFGSWRDNLIKAVYVPIPIGAFPSLGSKNVHLGFLDTGLSAQLTYPAYVKTNSSSVVIPWHAKCTTYHFLKYSKYSKFQAICCGGQFADIDADLIRDLGAGDSLDIRSAMDVCSGDWSAVITKGSSVNALRLASFGGNLGIDIAGLAGKGGLGMGMNYTMAGFKMAASALSMGLTNTMTSSAGESIAAVGTGIFSQHMTNAVSNCPSGIAGNGISSYFLNGSTGYNSVSLQGVCFYPSILETPSDYESYCQKYGYPCNKFGTIGANTGAFVKCEGAFVECKGNQQDQQFINSVLNSGILVES